MASSSFFEGVRQTPVRFDGQDVLFPNFVRDAGAMNAVFPARLSALRELLPDRRLVPARLAPGVGVVSVTAFEYRQSSIGPYNELAVAIMLRAPGARWNLPGVALASQHARGQYHAFIHRLPVTTEIARSTGELMGFPKLVGPIEFDHERHSCRFAEGDEHVLTLHGSEIATRRSGEFQNFVQVWMDGQPQPVELRVNALRYGDSVRPGAARLELSESHPLATELAALLLSRRSLAYRWIPSLEAIEFDPERVNLTLIAKAFESLQAHEPEGAAA